MIVLFQRSLETILFSLPGAIREGDIYGTEEGENSFSEERVGLHV